MKLKQWGGALCESAPHLFCISIRGTQCCSAAEGIKQQHRPHHVREKRWPGALFGQRSITSPWIHLVATTQTRSEAFSPWWALLSHNTDVCADASGLTSVMRTPSYAWWHPVRALASEGQTDKLFSLKFCISMGSDGSTWEGLIHAPSTRGAGDVSQPWVRSARMVVERQINCS